MTAATGVLGMWLLVSVTLGSIGLALISVVKSRRSKPGSARDLHVRAYVLCHAGNIPLSQVPADPRWASLASLASAKDFLMKVTPSTQDMSPELFAQSWTRFRRICLAAAGAWAVVTVSLFSLAQNSYTLIRNDRLEYSSLFQHVNLPLSQASGIETSCSVTAHKNSESYDPHYVITFQGHHLDIYGGRDDALNDLVKIDSYLKANHVPMQKLALDGQLDANTRTCLDQSGATSDPRKRQLIFG